ncbi:MAG: sulfurtransferase TusA family protein [Phycisphaerae bacterium]|jgi:TusA-related sulfurtransferase
MPGEAMDLLGRVCPYPVFAIVRAVDQLQAGQSGRFLVDDPLALKAVPEELEDCDGITIDVIRCAQGWEIVVTRA